MNQLLFCLFVKVCYYDRIWLLEVKKLFKYILGLIYFFFYLLYLIVEIGKVFLKIIFIFFCNEIYIIRQF